MTSPDSLYRSWISRGSYFYHMLHCGDRYNQSVQNALEYLPMEILDQYKDALAFYGMGQRDGCRVSRKICEEREIIILSERIFPRRGSNESQGEYRYFIYAVLHEVAHAVLKHKTVRYDNISQEENAAQETDADNLAMEWFNNHIEALDNPYLPPLTPEEIEVEQAKNREIMEQQWNR